jgi:hypothetical protein
MSSSLILDLKTAPENGHPMMEGWNTGGSHDGSGTSPYVTNTKFASGYLIRES